MIANFYIIPESLSFDNLSNEVFLSSFSGFISDYHLFRDNKDDNNIFIQDDVYNVILPNGKTLAEFIFSRDQTNGEERSLKQFLSSIFLKLPSCEITLDNLKENISNNSIESCVGIISLGQIDGIADENQIIYDSKSWLDFRRYHLGLYHGDSKYFITECIKYYPNLFFHENNFTSISSILIEFSQKIVFHLSALHDVLPKILVEQNGSHTDLLKKFSIQASLDEIATLEGANKTRLRFSFKNEEGGDEEVVCEPHIKLSTNNTNNGSYYFNRIYFAFGKPSIQNSKTLIAHIGKHL